MTREELLKVAKPILFNTEMVRAILDDRKTVTRRVIKPKDGFYVSDYNNKSILFEHEMVPHCSYMKDAPYQVGDILYVRETWYYESHMEDLTDGEPDLPNGKYSHRYIYKASSTDYPVNVGVGEHRWKPSLHMPKEAARIFLRVTDVRVERLQEIDRLWRNYDEEGMRNPKTENISIAMQERFIKTWNSTLKKSDIDRFGWQANPWVGVIKFERCEKND